MWFTFDSRLFSVSRESDIVRKPDAFIECLRNIFGARAFNVEAMVVASIIGKFHLTEIKQSDSGVRAITEARKLVWSEH